MASVQRIPLAYNSMYLVADGEDASLLDCGPDYRGAMEELSVALDGVLPRLVVATHGHLDHAGLGHAWRERGVPVGVGEDDAGLVRAGQLGTPGEFEALAGYARECGAPADVAVEAIAGLEQRRAWAKASVSGDGYPLAVRTGRWPTGLRFQRFEPDRLFREGNDVGSGLVVVSCPGHTPGNLVLIHEREGWLFSGDQLLPDITPIPAIQASPGLIGERDWRFRSLPAFYRALRRLEEREFTRCYPGHGEPFDNVGDVIHANVTAIEARGERIALALRELGPSSVFRVAERVYPRALRRRFWQIIATAQGQLDLLEDEGRVRMSEGGYEFVS